MKRYAYLWITLTFFLISIGLHWLFGWYSFVDEAAEHGQQPETRELPQRDGPRHVRELAVGVPAADLAGRRPRLLPLRRLAHVQGE